ncbi:hypothetical protein SAMN05444149_101731 [Pseudosulfitobacter pseudonitzschiae]|nr:hypothetical protein SAMN05444149_101731 [Pseudosulfitobacter pseudonitzschiae]
MGRVADAQGRAPEMQTGHPDGMPCLLSFVACYSVEISFG